MTVGNFIKRIGQFGSAVLMFALTAIMTLQVVARYIFNSPFDWTEEVCRIFFIAMIFVGAVSADHICVDVIPESIKQRYKFIIDKIILLLHTLYFGLIIGIFLYFQRSGTTFNTPMLEIPMYYLLAIAPICFALIVVKDWSTIKQKL